MCLLFVLVAGSSSGITELDYHLSVLQAVDGVTGVSVFGVEGRDKQHGINLYLRVSPDAPRKQIRVACAQDKPTKLEAALVAKQRVAAALGSAALEAAEERVRIERAAAVAAAAAAAAAGPPAPPSAFERMAAAQHVAPAEEAAAAAAKLAAEARAEVGALEKQLEAAAKRVEEAEAKAKQLEEAADDAREAAGLARKRQKAEEGDSEPTYRRWSPAKWNELETKEQARRAVPIDDVRAESGEQRCTCQTWKVFF